MPPVPSAVEIGYTLSGEERQPEELVRLAQRAEQVGFPYALISDHYHPWIDTQGSAPFAWSVLGGVAATTTRLRVGTGVTCPIMRYHPAIIAQASATIGCLMPGRFFLGVGSGESLSEHITGQAWPPPDVRQDMLEEAVDVKTFDASGGAGKPRYEQITVCWAASEEEAMRTALRFWPISGLSGEFKNELPRPAYLEQASKNVTPDALKKEIVCGPDPKRHLDGIAQFVKAGFDHVYVHQVGPDQEGFMRFYEREILPNAGELAA